MAKKTTDKKSAVVAPEESVGATIVKTIRIPTELFEKAEANARQQGSNFNDAVINALRVQVGLPTGEGAQFIQKIYDWVVSKWTDRNFPENVTHLVFRHIAATPALRRQYVEVTTSHEDKEIINRKIGKMVKQALKATVIGRSLPLTGEGELISSYALLRPTPKK